MNRALLIGMAEISRSPKMEFIPASVQGVHDGIVQAANSQEPESIERAIRSFDSISSRESYLEVARSGSAEQTSISGFVAAPNEYFNVAGASSGELVSVDQLSAAFRNPGFRLQQGVQSFLQSGIQESLASVKLKLGPRAERLEILEPLDELMRLDQIKDLKAARFQPSMDAVKEMYSTLRRTQTANNHLQLNMMRIIRA